MTISKREKDGTQPVISYMMCVIKVDMSFSQNTDVFVSVFAKLRFQILFQGISDATKIVIYHAVTIEIQRKKVRIHVLFYNEDK